MTLASIWLAQNHHLTTPSMGWSSSMRNPFPSRSLFGCFSDSRPVFMLALQGILMSPKVTDLSFVSCFDNTEYMNHVSPLYLLLAAKRKKGSWQRHWVKNTLRSEHIHVLNKGGRKRNYFVNNSCSILLTCLSSSRCHSSDDCLLGVSSYTAPFTTIGNLLTPSSICH